MCAMSTTSLDVQWLIGKRAKLVARWLTVLGHKYKSAFQDAKGSIAVGPTIYPFFHPLLHRQCHRYRVLQDQAARAV